MWASPADVRQYGIKDGDLLVCEGGEVGRASSVRNCPPICIIQNALHRVRARDSADVRFLEYVLRSVAASGWFNVTCSRATIAHFTREKFADMRMPIPPADAQRRIAGFLDRETGRIDALIEKKERQIELLKEKRAALISHAVTKGLDPNMEMKDSGIEWLGQIPAHWDLLNFKHGLVLQRGHDLPGDQFVDAPYPVCASNGVIGYHNEYTARGPSITVGRSGSVGEVNYVESDFWAHNTALYAKRFERVVPKYGYYLLLALDVKYLSEGTAVGTLNRNYIHSLTIALPHVSEQHQITMFLDGTAARIDSLTGTIARSIKLLQEYRSALISAAVTGKIDVREEVGK